MVNIPRPCTFITYSTEFCANFVLQVMNMQGLGTRLVQLTWRNIPPNVLLAVRLTPPSPPELRETLDSKDVWASPFISLFKTSIGAWPSSPLMEMEFRFCLS